MILYNPDTDEILLQKRDALAPVNPNLWAFFGGGGEPGETPNVCALRELKEEIGIDIPKETLIPLRRYLNERLKTWRYVFVAEFRIPKSAMVLGEGEDFDWVPRNIVFSYPLTLYTKSDLEFFAQQLGVQS